MNGSAMVEKDFVRRGQNSSECAASLLLLIYAKLFLFYLLGELELADQERCKIDPKLDFVGSYVVKPLKDFYVCMTCLGLARKQGSKKYVRLAKPYIDFMAEQAKAGSPNWIHVLKLMQAEEMSLTANNKNDSHNVCRVYDEAIVMAGRTGFRLIKAIALERAGDYMLTVEGEKSQSAADYLEQSWTEFAEYGAVAKLQQMEAKYPSVLEGRLKDYRPSKQKSSRKLMGHQVEVWQQKVT